MTIGSRLEQLRILNKWSIAEAARQLDLVYTTYRGYERDEREPEHDFLIKAATIYGVTTDYLLGLNDMGPLPKSVARTIKAMSKINNEGQSRVADYAEDLEASGRYDSKKTVAIANSKIDHPYKIAAYDGQEFTEEETEKVRKAAEMFRAKQGKKE